jgi:formate hydrogenlyase subunit 5
MTVHPAKRQKPVEARIAAECNAWWDGEVVATSDDAAGLCRITCSPPRLQELCEWLEVEMGYTLATLVVEETPDSTLTLTYVLYPATTAPWVYVELSIDALNAIVPSLAGLTRGPSVDWHEREAEDLFGLHFEGHPRLGEFVLHEDWPEGINPMRRSFDARQRFALREREPAWQPPTVLQAPGGFSMPVGPVFSDFAEAAHFLLETVGEEVIRTIPRFFYKFRGVEKIAEGQSVDRVLLLAERFSGTSAFAHALAFSQAVETICEIAVPPRARALRTVFAELERLRHHAATITSICNSTALAVATAQASLIEEDLLRLSAAVGRHRYLFALVEPGGVARDQSEEEVRHLATIVAGIAARLEDLHGMLRYSSSFLDRLEEVGMISADEAISYGLVGPVARAAGFARDMRKLRPYAAYETIDFAIPVEPEGDGYARLRIFFREAALSAAMIDQILPRMPVGAIRADRIIWRAGAALGAVEAPSGAAFHWVRLGEGRAVQRYRITSPAFTNWHAFHLAAENFAFQDFPIILASFGLSNAECDR